MNPSRQQTPVPWHHGLLLGIIMIVGFPFIVIFLFVALLPWLKVRYFDRPRLLARVKKEWLPQGKIALVVYSDNAAWKEYVFTNLLPKIGAKAEVLNWSEYAVWKNSSALAARLFNNFTWGTRFVSRRRTRPGAQDFNRQVIIFNPWNKPETISFHKAFRQHELGNDAPLGACEKKVFERLNTIAG